MTVHLQPHQYWDSLSSEIAWDSLYIANIGDMRLRLLKFQDKNKEAKVPRAAGLPED